MTHCMLTMLVAVLLQPPATPPKPQPEPNPPFKLKEITDEKQAEIVTRLAANQIEKWLTNHPDIRVAEAKLMEAQAALAQAKFKVGVELVTNQAKLGQLRADLVLKKETFQRAEEARRLGSIGVQEYAKILADLNSAKATLEPFELLSKAVQDATGSPDSIVRVESQPVYATRLFNDHRELRLTIASSHPLHDLLQRKVKFAVKATDKDQTVIGVLERSMKEWDFANAKVIVRYPHDTDPGVRSAYTVQPVEGENTIGVWLMMMLDDYNAPHEQPKGPAQGKHQIYVRDYGLLFTLVKNAPDGAPTLAEFLRQPKK